MRTDSVDVGAEDVVVVEPASELGGSIVVAGSERDVDVVEVGPSASPEHAPTTRITTAAALNSRGTISQPPESTEHLAASHHAV
jgi:hypothetical protein